MTCDHEIGRKLVFKDGSASPSGEQVCVKCELPLDVIIKSEASKHNREILKKLKAIPVEEYVTRSFKNIKVVEYEPLEKVVQEMERYGN